MRYNKKWGYTVLMNSMPYKSSDFRIKCSKKYSQKQEMYLIHNLWHRFKINEKLFETKVLELKNNLH